MPQIETIETGARGPLGDDLFPALQVLGNFTKQHVKFLLPILMVLTAQSTDVSHWFPLQYSGPALILYAAYSGGHLGLQDLKRHKLLIPALILLWMRYPALPESIDSTVQHGAIVPIAIYVYYNRENLELQNLETSPLLVLLAVLVTQIEPDAGGWTIAIALFLIYQKTNNSEGEQKFKFSLPLLIGAALVIPSLSLPQAWAATSQTQKLVLFLTAYVAHHADKEATAQAAAEALVAIQTVNNRVGVYFKVGSMMGIACYMPIYHGLPLQFQVWVHCLAVAVVALVGYFSSPTRFCGPARYGYINYSGHFVQLCSALCDWWIYAVFFVLIPACLPFLGFGIMATVAATWIVVWREYTVALTYIADRACLEASRASLAEESAREYASTADRYRKKMLEAVAVARRDAFLAQSARATDFFDCTATAWAALEGIIKPVDDMVQKAEETIEAAQKAEDAQDEQRLRGFDDYGEQGGDDDDDDNNADEEGDDDDGFGKQGVATELFEAASLAKEKAVRIREKLTTAQENIRTSKAANRHHDQTRIDANANAETAITAAKEIEAKLLPSTNHVSTASKHAALAKALAAQATAVATDGDMVTAQGLLDSARSAADTVEQSKDELLLIMNNARKVVLEYMGVA
ncbi:hypothetical protein AA313_de0206752 [Arthrobotrys entomopaga]|nr:hypothetical protein AA313_de0206752 [Arthrobotrys entomopaga]